MSATPTPPSAIIAADAPPRARLSNYPEPFASRVAGRVKQALGEPFGLKNFGVNRVQLLPGRISALRHAHTRQDEFIYVLEGHPTLVTDAGETQLAPGMCAGFPAGGTSHQLVNRTNTPVLYLEAGDRLPGDSVSYPDDALQAQQDAAGGWRFLHKDGRPY